MRLRFFILALLLGIACYFGYKHFFGGDGGEQQMGAAPVSVATVIVKDMTQWAEFPGRLEAVYTAEIRPRVAGSIQKIHFRDGQMVKKGQVLFTIDTKPYNAEVARAKGSVATANSLYVNAKAEFDRAEPLLQTQNISKRDFDSRKSALYQAEGQLMAAKGDLALAQVNLDYASVQAPFAGRVGRAEITVGNVVNSGFEAPILTTIVATSPMYASFEVDEQNFLNHIQGVSEDKLATIPVEIGLANQDGTPYKAKIHAFDNQLSAGSGTIRVRAIVDNADGALLPGLFAKVRMGSADAATTILVNEKAISTDQNKKFVFVMGANNMPEFREVTLGQSVDGLRVVKTGLKANETIVVNGLMRIRPGAPISPEPVDMITLEPVK